MQIKTEDLKEKIKKGESLQKFTFWVDGTEYTNLQDVPEEQRKKVTKILGQKVTDAIGNSLNPYTEEIEKTSLVRNTKKIILLPTVIMGIIVSVISDAFLEISLQNYDIKISTAFFLVYGVVVGYASGKISEHIYNSRQKNREDLLSKIKFINNIRRELSIINISIFVDLAITIFFLYILNLVA